MEYEKSQFDEKNNSPSQETISNLQPLKREVESLEDFEYITKDNSSVKDITTQFLESETNDRNVHQTVDLLFKSEDDNYMKPNLQTSSTVIMDSINFQSENNIGKNEPKERTFSESVIEEKDSLARKNGQDDYLNNLMYFDQTKVQNIKDEGITHKELTNKFSENQDNLQNENDVSQKHANQTDNENLPDSDSDSEGSSNLAYFPKKGESSSALPSDVNKDYTTNQVFESKSENETELSYNSPAAKYISEPGSLEDEESLNMFGDGLHVKKNNEEDVSDNEDIVPEPIPKDYPEIGIMDGKQLLEVVGIDTWFHPDSLNPKIESLVYWRDPKKSGVVFGSVMVVLLSLTTFSLISVVAYGCLTVLGAALSFRIYKSVLQAVQKTSEGHPFKEYLDVDVTLNPDKAREISDMVVSFVNNTLTTCRNLFLVEDIIESLKFGVCLWCLTYVGAWFNGLSLLIIAFVGLFTLPKVYENNKTQIDANLNIVREKINEVTEKLKAVSPVGKKTEESKNKSE